jgi:hypothetical protein
LRISPQCLLKCLKRKVNKQSGGCKSPPLLCAMKDETLDNVLEMLDSEVYTTRRVLTSRTQLSPAAITSALDILLDECNIERIYVKNKVGSGRAEAAYRKVDDE